MTFFLLFFYIYICFLSMKLFYFHLIFILLTNKIIEMLLEYCEYLFSQYWQVCIFCIELLLFFFFLLCFVVDILFSNDIIKLTEFIKFIRVNYLNIIFFLCFKKYLFIFYIFYNKTKINSRCSADHLTSVLSKWTS